MASVSLKRPRQFLFHLLYWQQFEELICSLGLRLFGSGLTSFKAGRDGGRDARFEGTPSKWPSESEQEHGKYVLQSKHTSKEGACCSDSDFKTTMKDEGKKIKKLVAAKDISHYVVFTNRTKSASEDLTFRTDFQKIKGLSRAWLVGKEHLHTLLNDHIDLWQRYEEEVANPVRFNREDLIKVIRSFSEFIQRDPHRPRIDSLRHLNLKQKNDLNNITPEYFAERWCARSRFARVLMARSPVDFCRV